jgi:hypothetical protein
MTDADPDQAPVTADPLAVVQDKVRDLFFALAFDPDSAEAAQRADDALRELDGLLAAADADAGPVRP